MTFSLLIEKIKRESSPDKVIALMGNKSMVDGASAWRFVPITPNTPEYKNLECPCADVDHEAWEWLWQQVSFDIETFRVISGVKILETNKTFSRLKALRIIYPDGTVDVFATQYMNSLILSQLSGKPQREKKEKSG